MPEIAFVGLSHLGQVYSACWHQLGLPVVTVHQGEVPAIDEPDMPTAAPRVEFTGLINCPLVIISLDIWDQHPESVVPVRRLAAYVRPYLTRRSTVVILSQVPLGFTRSLDLGCPVYTLVDTLRLGDAVARCLSPEQFIVGCENPAAPLPSALVFALEKYFRCPVHRLSYEQAEMAKMAINVYLIGQVTCTNTLYDVCRAAGIAWGPITDVLRDDARIGPHAYLRPSVGVHGGHIERDLIRLREQYQDRVNTGYLESLEAQNAHRAGEVEEAWVRVAGTLRRYARALSSFGPALSN